jgi:hypothetical protein
MIQNTYKNIYIYSRKISRAHTKRNCCISFREMLLSFFCFFMHFAFSINLACSIQHLSYIYLYGNYLIHHNIFKLNE